MCALCSIFGGPFLGWENIVGRLRSTANITGEPHGECRGCLETKHSEHILHKLPDLVRLTFGFFVDVLQMGNHVLNFIQSLLHLRFLLLEFVNQFTDIIQAAFAFRAVTSRLQNLVGVLVTENDMTLRGRDLKYI